MRSPGRPFLMIIMRSHVNFCVLRAQFGAQKWFSGVPKPVLWGSKPRLLNACPTNCEFSAPISDHVALKKAGPIELALELEVELEVGFDVDLEPEIDVEIELELALEPNVKKCSNFGGVFFGAGASGRRPGSPPTPRERGFGVGVSENFCRRGGLRVKMQVPLVLPGCSKN